MYLAAEGLRQLRLVPAVAAQEVLQDLAGQHLQGSGCVSGSSCTLVCPDANAWGRPGVEATEQSLCQARQALVAGLYASALRQGGAWGFDDEQLSTLVGLLAATHAAAVAGALTQEASFRQFARRLLCHSAHR